MRSDQRHTAADPAQRQGNIAVRCTCQARGNPVDQFHLNPAFTQPQRFFAAPAENTRVAALKSHHAFALARIAQHQAVDKILGCRTAAAALAHGYHPSVRAVLQHPRVDQIIDQHHIGCVQGAYRLEG